MPVMRYFESVHLRVITKSTDDIGEIRSRITDFLPFDLAKEKVLLSEDSFLDAHEQERFILVLHLTRQRHVRAFTKAVHSVLPRETILAQLESRLDENCDFFLRFDLDAFLADGSLVLTDLGRCLHCKLAVAAYPRKRETALDVVRNYLNAKDI